MTVTYGGVNISGKVAEVESFLTMVTSMGTDTSRAARALITGDTAHPDTVNVGRGQRGVIIDSFASNDVDMGDLERVPATPVPGHPNTTTQDEMILHFMVERNNAAVTGNPDFGPAHQAGIDAQNQMRAERGQSPVTSQVFAGTPRLRESLFSLGAELIVFVKVRDSRYEALDENLGVLPNDSRALEKVRRALETSADSVRAH